MGVSVCIPFRGCICVYTFPWVYLCVYLSVGVSVCIPSRGCMCAQRVCECVGAYMRVWACVRVSGVCVRVNLSVCVCASVCVCVCVCVCDASV